MFALIYISIGHLDVRKLRTYLYLVERLNSETFIYYKINCILGDSMSEILELADSLGAVISVSWDVDYAGKTYTITLALDEFDLMKEQAKGSVEIKRKDA